MNNQLIGSILLKHDYSIVNNGLERIIRHSEYQDRLSNIPIHPVEQIPANSIIFCGIDSLHKLTYQSKLHPILRSNRCKVIILVDPNAKFQLSTLLAMGVSAVINSGIEEDKIVDIIKLVARGSSFVSPKLNLKSLDNQTETAKRLSFNKLTERELEVLKCISDEMTNKEIAKALFISPRTVETHRRNLIQKLKVKTSVGLVKAYLRTE